MVPENHRFKLTGIAETVRMSKKSLMNVLECLKLLQRNLIKLDGYTIICQRLNSNRYSGQQAVPKEAKTGTSDNFLGHITFLVDYLPKEDK